MVPGEITLSVFRFDPERPEDAPRYQNYRVSTRPGMTVLEALFEVLERQDGSLAFRYACRQGICGSSAMFINGSYLLACQTQLSRLGKRIAVSPLPHLPLIKDLVVDWEPFFQHYQAIMPFLAPEKLPPADREFLQSPTERREIDEMLKCILCACCYSSCPMVWQNPSYLGPAALLKAYRFVADSRSGALDRRLELIDFEDGVWRCHTVFNCHEACPKRINPTYSIQRLKGRAVVRRLR